MLKRLLGRSKTVTEEVVEPVEAPEVPATEAATPMPSPFDAPKPEPPPQAPKIRRKREAIRSRASDVRDEHGRTAEEIAAEANKDFDIMAVARRAAELPEEVEGPDTQLEEAVAEALESIVPEPAPVEPAAPAAVVDPAPSAELDKGDPGHIVMPGADGDAEKGTQAARDAYWAQWGESDASLIGYDTNPQALGAPAWPNTRQNFRLIRTEASLIIASEGLSDPFGAFSGGGTTNGFGMEVFMEVMGWQGMRLKEAKSSWAFAAIEHVARVVAQARGIVPLLDEHRVLSIDLPYSATPEAWADPDEPQMPGGLLGLGLPDGRDRLQDTPLSPVRMVPLTMITPDELEACLIGGAEDRLSLADDLMTTGVGHHTVPDRMSLR